MCGGSFTQNITILGLGLNTTLNGSEPRSILCFLDSSPPNSLKLIISTLNVQWWSSTLCPHSHVMQIENNLELHLKDGLDCLCSPLSLSQTRLEKVFHVWIYTLRPCTIRRKMPLYIYIYIHEILLVSKWSNSIYLPIVLSFVCNHTKIEWSKSNYVQIVLSFVCSHSKIRTNNWKATCSKGR